jgi:PHD/YefM family antitoxin component YafN of YafNO toxin-antitoxin module
MIQVHPQFVVDEKKKRKAVIIPLEEWEQILDALEELDDIQAYDSAKETEQERIPFEDAVKEIEQGYDS